jgi:phytoene synthase
MQRFFEHTRAADIGDCRSLLKNGSRTFYAASFLLPRRVREPASALYAFCRLADDSVDLDEDTRAVERLCERLDKVYRGAPEAHPVDRAMAHVVETFAIPRHVPDALIEGLAWDRTDRRYADIGALRAYAARVAGTVGVMMALIMGVRGPALLGRAADLGVAMQFTNIARDIGEDARAGRVYLPLAWLKEVGIDPDQWLAQPRFSPAVGVVVERLLAEADVLYQRAGPGIAGLPVGCRPGIQAARLLYAEIGNEVRRNGLDSVNRRAVVPAGRKAALLAQVLSASDGRSAETLPCLEQTRFLIENIGAAPDRAGLGVAWWDFHARVVWVLDLFERVERRRYPDMKHAERRITA